MFGVTEICMWSDFEENLNLPKGPVHVAADWRASARKIIGIHTTCIWGGSLGKKLVGDLHFSRDRELEPLDLLRDG